MGNKVRKEENWEEKLNEDLEDFIGEWELSGC
jgi:hypothetical protein